MHRTFNCGIGMVVDRRRRARRRRPLQLLLNHGETAMLIGEVRRGERGVVIASDR